MPLILEELLCHLPERERAGYLALPEPNRRELADWIRESERLPRSSADLLCAPGTVSGPAIGRTRECVRGRVEMEPFTP